MLKILSRIFRILKPHNLSQLYTLNTFFRVDERLYIKTHIPKMGIVIG